MASFCLGIWAVYPKLDWTAWVNSSLAFIIIAWVFGLASMGFLGYLKSHGAQSLHKWMRKILIFQSINIVFVAIAAMVTVQWSLMAFLVVLTGYIGLVRFQVGAIKPNTPHGK
jgi:membrane-associated HD superfamily phosphohydrolase